MKKIISLFIFIFTILPASGWSEQLPKAALEQKWNAVLAAAKKEGTVSVYNTGWLPQVRVALTQAFKNKYGINLEFTPFSRGSEMAVKAAAEYNAGIQTVDVFGCGAPSLVTTLKPKGLLGNISQLLILPDVTDPKKWTNGRFPFLDKDKLAIGMAANINRYIVYNANLVKEGEITTYQDVFKPRFKGKLTLNDPSVTGSGQGFMTHLAYRIWNVDEASEFLKQLIIKQHVDIQRDNRTQVESVARGKYAVALAAQPPSVIEFLKMGAPLKVLINKDGTSVDVAAGGLGIAAKPPHPNAATVFINWLLTKEGQTVFSRHFGLPSIRVDVPTDNFIPFYLPQPGEKLFFLTEEVVHEMAKMLAISKKIIAANK